MTGVTSTAPSIAQAVLSLASGVRVQLPPKCVFWHWSSRVDADVHADAVIKEPGTPKTLYFPEPVTIRAQKFHSAIESGPGRDGRTVVSPAVAVSTRETNNRKNTTPFPSHHNNTPTRRAPPPVAAPARRQYKSITAWAVMGVMLLAVFPIITSVQDSRGCRQTKCRGTRYSS
eukprot:COSAG02_NODE_456_length_21968_cov_13.528145_11_plen_173_part_00